MVKGKSAPLDEIAAAMEKAGPGSMFAVPNHSKEWRRIVELQTAAEFVRSAACKWGISLSDLQNSDDDPPDCYAQLCGKTVGIELTELTDKRRRARVARDYGSDPKHDQHAQRWDESQWDLERFERELNAAIAKKGANYARQGRFIDILVIHSDEPWLRSAEVEAWLSEMSIVSHGSIRSAFLLFTYDPDQPEFWPVCKIYGDFAVDCTPGI